MAYPHTASVPRAQAGGLGDFQQGGIALGIDFKLAAFELNLTTERFVSQIGTWSGEESAVDIRISKASFEEKILRLIHKALWAA